MSEARVILHLEMEEKGEEKEFNVSGNFSQLSTEDMQRVFSWLQIELAKKIHERMGQEQMAMIQKAAELKAKGELQ